MPNWWDKRWGFSGGKKNNPRGGGGSSGGGTGGRGPGRGRGRGRGGGASGSDGNSSVSTTTLGSGTSFEWDLTGYDEAIFVLNDLSLSGTDIVRIQFRRQSDATWETGANTYRWTAVSQGSGVTPTQDTGIDAIAYNAANGTSHMVYRFANFSVAAPTTVQGRTWSNSGTIRHGFVQDANIHDRVRLIVEGAATFTGGTAYVTLRKTSPTVETFNMTSSPASTVSGTPTSGSYCTDVIGLALGNASSSTHRMRIDGDTTSDYNYSFVTSTGTDDVTGNAQFFAFTNHAATSGQNVFATVWGMKSAAPVVAENCTLSNSLAETFVMYKDDATVNNTIEIYSPTAVNINAGTIYFVHHNRVVEDLDTGTTFTTEASYTASGLGTKDCVVMVAPDLSHTASDTLTFQVSNGSFKTTSGDYETSNFSGSASAAGADASIFDSDSVGGSPFNNDIVAVFYNVKRPGMPTCCLMAGEMADAETAPRAWGGYETTAATTTAIRADTVGASTLDGGTMYVYSST